MNRVLLTNLLCLLIAMIPLPGNAETLDFTSIAEDFKQVEGVLVMPLDDKWLIDVDAKQGVSAGDLFSFVEKGPAVIHPTTNEVIGYINQKRAVLKITKIASGYSYAVVVKQDGELKPGLPVHRFTGLTARMLDATGKGRALYNDLQAAVPQLEWVGYETSGPSARSTADLTFRYDGSNLTVTGANESPLRFYTVQQSTTPTAQNTTTQIDAPGVAANAGIVAGRQSQITPQSGNIVVTQQKSSQKGVWRSSPFKDVAVGMDVADLDGDGKMEIAVLTASRVEISRLIDGEYQQVASYKLPPALKALGLDATDLDKNGRAELYLTAARNEAINSLVLDLDGTVFKEAATNLPYYFRNTYVAGEGKILLGQRAGTYDNPFNGAVFRVQRQGAEVSRGPALHLPKNTNIYSFASLGNDRFARLRKKSLVVTSADGVIWEGSAFNAASEVYIDYIDPNDPSRTETLPFFIPPRLVLADNGTVLATEHKESFMSHRLQTHSQGRISAYQWDGSALQEIWHTKPQAGYLADFAYADADNDGVREIIGFVTISRSTMFSTSHGRSALMIYELN